jgi:hypothetical protein
MNIIDCEMPSKKITPRFERTEVSMASPSKRLRHEENIVDTSEDMDEDNMINFHEVNQKDAGSHF